MQENTPVIRFLYGTAAGRWLTKIILHTHADRLAVAFLRSGLSRPYIGWFARKHGLEVDREQKKQFRSFQDFFSREREGTLLRKEEPPVR